MLFKFLGPDVVSKALGDDSVSIRFSFPRDYNDPYELFLAPDKPLRDDDVRAYYEFFLHGIPQAPVTCFSRCPDSVLMWAHYCSESSGVCLGFDEDRLVDEFDYAFIHDVEYSDEPATISTDVVEYAATTTKRRHTVRVLEIANRAAYFRKRADWAYEKERRLVVVSDAVHEVGGVQLANVAASCLTVILVGARASESVAELTERRAAAYGVPALRTNYGRLSTQPFFTSASGTRVWEEPEFVQVARACVDCGEPVNAERCEWCALSSDRVAAAGTGNALVIGLRLGVIDGLSLSFDDIEPRGRRVGESRDDDT